MAQNHVQEGKIMPWTNGTGAAVASGDVIDMGAMIGVALVDIADGGEGNVAVEEVFELAKDAAAIDQGAQVYLTPDGLITAAADDGAGTTYTPAGKAFAAAADTDATVKVMLNV